MGTARGAGCDAWRTPHVLRTYVRTCVVRVDWGGAARREGEGAREEGGSRHLGSSSRHNKAPGEREDFVPGRGGARLVAIEASEF